MNNVLVINCGSSSVKYQLLDMDQQQLLAKGLVERIGLETGRHVYERPGQDALPAEQPIDDHATAVGLVRIHYA